MGEAPGYVPACTSEALPLDILQKFLLNLMD